MPGLQYPHLPRVCLQVGGLLLLLLLLHFFQLQLLFQGPYFGQYSLLFGSSYLLFSQCLVSLPVYCEGGHFLLQNLHLALCLLALHIRLGLAPHGFLTPHVRLGPFCTCLLQFGSGCLGLPLGLNSLLFCCCFELSFILSLFLGQV